MRSSYGHSALVPFSLLLQLDLHKTMWDYYVRYGKLVISSVVAEYGLTSLSAREVLLSAMTAGITKGSLVIIEDDTAHVFGQPAVPGQAPVTLRVNNANFWCRIYASHDLGCKLHYTIFVDCVLIGNAVAEAYMHGDFTATPSQVKDVLDVSAIVDSLQIAAHGIRQLWLQNRHNLSSLTSVLSRAASIMSAMYVRAFGQSLENAKLNVVSPPSHLSLYRPICLTRRHADHRL